MVRPRVFFDFSLENEPIGRVIFELFDDVVPKTVENFRCLVTGERGVSAKSQVPLSYKGSIIHRSITDFMIQGGDFTKKNGTGGESIYGGTFDDENFDLPLDAEGLLVMANRGPNTNGSQFFVTLRACPHLNGKHVVFGRVVKGYEIITKIAEVPTDEKSRPTRPIIISGSGELVLRKKAAPTQTTTEPLVPRGRSRSRSLSRSRSPSVPRRSSSLARTPLRKRGRSASQSSQSRSPTRSLSRSRSRSISPPKRSHKHKKSSKKSKVSKQPADSADNKPGQPERETEEELDARLEREENERLAEAKRHEAARLKERLQAESRRKEDSTGVRFKGRGMMRFRDPETERR